MQAVPCPPHHPCVWAGAGQSGPRGSVWVLGEVTFSTGEVSDLTWLPHILSLPQFSQSNSTLEERLHNTSYWGRSWAGEGRELLPKVCAHRQGCLVDCKPCPGWDRDPLQRTRGSFNTVSPVVPVRLGAGSPGACLTRLHTGRSSYI